MYILSKFKTLFLKDLVTGILVLVPIVFSYWLILKIYSLIKNTFSFMNQYINDTTFTITLISLIIIFIILIGNLVRNKAKNSLIDLQDSFLKKIPFVNKIYIFMKETIELFSASNEENKIKVCLVEFGGLKTLGFLNAKDKESSICTVFVPTGPNPTNGFTFFVEDKLVFVLDVNKEDALSNIISLGTKGSEKLKTEISRVMLDNHS
jgi:uncharacterized membrane protein